MTDRHVGFTGTRYGMTLPQEQWVLKLIFRDAEWVHHGDCVGADARVHQLAIALKLKVVLHPPESKRWRAYCEGADEVLPEAEYKRRNREIVRHTQRLAAAPYSAHEERLSGTWATIRFARKIGRPVTIVYPDGSVSACGG